MDIDLKAAAALLEECNKAIQSLHLIERDYSINGTGGERRQSAVRAKDAAIKCVTVICEAATMTRYREMLDASVSSIKTKDVCNDKARAD